METLRISVGDPAQLQEKISCKHDKPSQRIPLYSDTQTHLNPFSVPGSGRQSPLFIQGLLTHAIIEGVGSAMSLLWTPFAVSLSAAPKTERKAVK